MAEEQTHDARPMGGRDPHETHRVASSLELLFDLTFVVAYGVAGDQLASAIHHHHTGAGLLGFAFAVFAITWAWIFFTWFASAYDTDDAPFRLLTMVQMVGVLILSLGLPRMFESVEAGGHIDNRVMVIGYIVMRVPMVFQWLRAARQDPGRASLARTMVATILVAQAGWCVLAVADTSVGVFIAGALVLVLVELAGPVLAERRHGGTPWHAHHIAERYGLLVIVTLGEGILGTAIALRELVEDGWTADIAVLGLAGVALVFGVWWAYFAIPFGAFTHAHRERSFGWGYGHLPVFGGLVAIGAGLHVAAYELTNGEPGNESIVTTATVVWSLAIPTAVVLLGTLLLYAQLTRTFDRLHVVLAAGSVAVLAIGVGMGLAGAPMIWCVAVLALAPWVMVIGYETIGRSHQEQLLARL
jgi:low temperature requirement protein LtrA